MTAPALPCIRAVDGKTYWQWVAQADVTLSRAAKPSRKKGGQPAAAEIPVMAKLGVSRVLAEDGAACWLT
ncbi:MAG: hypothetical protein PHU14_09740 [Methylovulum sp.]|nr:hypothetical protein [Methylovulum sp.]